MKAQRKPLTAQQRAAHKTVWLRARIDNLLPLLLTEGAAVRCLYGNDNPLAKSSVRVVDLLIDLRRTLR